MVEPLPPGHLLVLRPRRPDPTPPARALPPSRARRSRGRPSISPVVGAISLVAAALLLVAQSAAATQASYQIATLKQEQARLSDEHDQLQAQLAADRAANRVAIAAQQLGMAHPGRWQFVKAADSPIALGPLPANQGRSGVWDHVLAVIGAITGRPLAVHASSSR
jgi:cell division protein FtsL